MIIKNEILILPEGNFETEVLQFEDKDNTFAKKLSKIVKSYF